MKNLFVENKKEKYFESTDEFEVGDKAKTIDHKNSVEFEVIRKSESSIWVKFKNEDKVRRFKIQYIFSEDHPTSYGYDSYNYEECFKYSSNNYIRCGSCYYLDAAGEYKMSYAIQNRFVEIIK